MKLEVGKKYKDRAGNVAEILKVDLRSNYPCMGFVTFFDSSQAPGSWMEDGTYAKSVTSSMDLVSEVTPYDDFEIDEKVVVWDERNLPNLRYFAGVEKGYATAWRNGATSWSAYSGSRAKWPNCVKFSEYTPEAHGHKK